MDKAQLFPLFFLEGEIPGAKKAQAVFYGVRRRQTQGLHFPDGFYLAGGSHHGDALQPFSYHGVELLDGGKGYIFFAELFHPVGDVEG